MTELVLHLKGEYFDKICDGDKTKEYRLVTPYWEKRLIGREYDCVVICKGYPSWNDTERRRNFPYKGYEVETITHEHFGPDPVEVFAIDLSQKLPF